MEQCIFHQQQSSYDSTDLESYPPTCSRLPPDGHEFPEEYVAPSLKSLQSEMEHLSRKSSASSTTSLDRHDLILSQQANKTHLMEDSISSVRAKIAMFSNSSQENKVLSTRPVLKKFQSFEEVGKASGIMGSLARSQTQGDVRFQTDMKNQHAVSSLSQKHLDGTNGTSEKVSAQSCKAVTSLKERNNKSAFSNLKNMYSVAKDSNASTLISGSTDLRKARVSPPLISNRSQSLNELGRNQHISSNNNKSESKPVRSQTTGTIAVPGQQQKAVGYNRKSSVNVMLEQRRRSTLTKLKGIVIEDIKEESVKKESTGISNNKHTPIEHGKDKQSHFSSKSARSPVERVENSVPGLNTSANLSLQTKRSNDEKTKPKTNTDPRILKRNSVEAINRQNVINACKRSSSSMARNRDLKDLKKTESIDNTSLSKISTLVNNGLEKKSSQSTLLTSPDKKKTFQSGTADFSSSKRGASSSPIKEPKESNPTNIQVLDSSHHSYRSISPPSSNSFFPDSILNIEEKVAYMTDVVDRAVSITPTERKSLSRTNSTTSDRSTISCRSSRNSSIVSEKSPHVRNNSILSRDSAICEDIINDQDENTSFREDKSRWSELEKKYSTEEKLPKTNFPTETKNERPKDLPLAKKKFSSGNPSPGTKNFKELAEKWKTLSIDNISSPSSIESITPTIKTSCTLPRNSSKEKIILTTGVLDSTDKTYPTMTWKNLEQKSAEEQKCVSWSPPALTKNPYYQVNGGETEWSGFNSPDRCDFSDRKFSVPAFNEQNVKLRDKRDNMPSRPSSLIESSEQRDLKIFEIGNLGDTNRLLMNSNSTSQSSSQADLLDSQSVASDTPKSPLPSSGSREIMNAFGNQSKQQTVTVNDIKSAFEKAEQSLSNNGTPTRSGLSTSLSHNRMSSLDSTTSEESSIPAPHFYGSVNSLTSGHSGGLKDHYGSISSLASSTSMISHQELQNLIDEANHSLEESGTPSHEIMVVVLHREFSAGSIGITLAGGADYECKEITVHKVIAGSLADRDGRIQKGDRVLSINGRSTKGVMHREALNILKAPRTEVVLVLSRSRSVTPADRGNLDVSETTYNYINTNRPPKILESPLDSKSLIGDMKYVDVPRGPPTTVTLKKEGTGLGFSLEGGKDSPYGDRPITIKKIFTGGAADKNGVLEVGDEILAVNTVDITRMTRLEAWNFMKKLNDGNQVVLIRKKLNPSSKQDLIKHTNITVPIVKAEMVGESKPDEKTP